MKPLNLLLLSALLISSCAVEVKSLKSSRADFTSYQSFCWLNGCDVTISGNPMIKDTLLQGKLQRAIVREMNRKGLRLNATDPDLLVGVYVTLKDEHQIIYRRQDDLPLFWPSATEQENLNYLKGTIVVAMAERETGTLVYESVGIRYMELNPKLSRTDIRRVVQGILADYPVLPKQP
ncbi:MAG: DUF4136 domain-containing protein [Bacteroidota bacterium]